MSELNKEVLDLVWGRPSSGGVSASIFRRWTQGNYVFLYYGCPDIWGFNFAQAGTVYYVFYSQTLR